VVSAAGGKQGTMTDEPTNKVLDKIRKLLALSKSSNANEAAAAAAKAADLMRQHKLEETDITEATQDGSLITELPMGADGFMASWRFALISAVARSCFCEALALRVGQRRKVRLVGRRDDTEVAQEIFKHVAGEIERLADEELDDPFVVLGVEDVRSYKDNFRRGAAVGVADRLKVEARVFARSSDKALVLVRSSHDEVKSYLKNKYGASETVEGAAGGKLKRDAADTMAYARGYDKGSEIQTKQSSSVDDKLLPPVDSNERVK